MTDRTLQLVSDFEPAGDQPQAIAQLVDGLTQGLAKQTLLGVTGSGKSIGYDDPLLIEQVVDGASKTCLVRAGEFIDSLMKGVDLGADGLGDWNIPWEQWNAGNAGI